MSASPTRLAATHAAPSRLILRDFATSGIFRKTSSSATGLWYTHNRACSTQVRSMPARYSHQKRLGGQLRAIFRRGGRVNKPTHTEELSAPNGLARVCPPLILLVKAVYARKPSRLYSRRDRTYAEGAALPSLSLGKSAYSIQWGQHGSSKATNYTNLSHQLHNSVFLMRSEPRLASRRRRDSHALAPEKSALLSPLAPPPIPSTGHGSPASTRPHGAAYTLHERAVSRTRPGVQSSGA